MRNQNDTPQQDKLQTCNRLDEEMLESVEGDAQGALRAPSAKDVQQVKVVIEPRHK